LTAIAVVLPSVAMIDLRIFGMAGRQTPLNETADRYLPEQTDHGAVD
jgi:accessory colonization factor AcfC